MSIYRERVAGRCDAVDIFFAFFSLVVSSNLRLKPASGNVMIEEEHANAEFKNPK